MAGAVDIVHVGSASRDLADDDPRGWRLGGGVSYSALMTARLGLRTAALVGADRPAATAPELDILRSAGVEVRVQPLAAGPVFRNVERPEGRIQLCVEPGVPLPASSLPEGWRAAPTWMILPVAGETEPGWATVVPDAAWMGLAWQGLLRRLVRGETVTRRPAAASPLLGRADLVGVSHHDLMPGVGAAALTPFLDPGAGLLITRGLDGGTLIPAVGSGRAGAGAAHVDDAEQAIGVGRAAGELDYAAIPAPAEIDPTGAGDVFLSAFVAQLMMSAPAGLGRGLGDLQPDVVASALRCAAAAASLVVEGPGLLGVPTLPAIEERLGRS